MQTAKASFLVLFAALCLALASCQTTTVSRDDTGSSNNFSYTLSKPSGKGPFPIVALLHGCSGLQQSVHAALLEHASVLNEAGYATAIIDGFSARGFDTVCDDTGAMAELRIENTMDALKLLDVLAADPQIDVDRAVFMGQSHGGSVALNVASPSWRAAADTKRKYRAIVAYYPYCFPSYGGWGFGTADFDTGTLVLSGELDRWTPVSACQQLKVRGNIDYRIEVFPGAYHSFDLDIPRYYVGGYKGAEIVEGNPTQKRRSREIYLKWLASKLKAKPKPPSN